MKVFRRTGSACGWAVGLLMDLALIAAVALFLAVAGCLFLATRRPSNRRPSSAPRPVRRDL